MKSIRKEENNSPPAEDQDHLPARRRQSTALLQTPRQGLKTAVERGASIYYTSCRRIARLLNRKK